MQIKMPQNNRRWTGPYLGNYQGDLYRTYNVDLDRNPGHISLSMNFNSQGDSNDTVNLPNLGVIDAFLRTDADNTDRWWGLIRSGRLVRTDSSNPLSLNIATWIQDTLASSPTDALDMTIHENDSDSGGGQNKLFVTRAADIAVLNDTAANTWVASWWQTTKSQAALKTVPHPIEYFAFQRISIVGDGNLIHTIDKNGAVSNSRIVLPTYLQIWGIFTTDTRAWILCEGLKGHSGAIVEWDGFSQTYNKIHDGQANVVLTGVNYYGIPIVINNRGLILEYNGNTFVPLVRNGQKIAFPSYEETDNKFLITDFAQGTRYMTPRGMTVTDDGLIYINMSNPFFASERHLAGVWCLNMTEGRLYSKHTFALGSDADYGAQVVTSGNIGAIKAIGPDATSGISSNAYLLAGAKLTNVSGITQSAIWALLRNMSSQSVRRGYFITQYIPSSEIQEFWDSIWLEISKFRSLVSLRNKIIVKAKGVSSLLTENRYVLQGDATWTSATTFTITLGNTGDSSDPLAVGDEIEVLNGKNAGNLAHITAISGSQGFSQTITIDETMVNTSGASVIRFDRWKKLGVITDTTKYVIPLNTGITSSFTQFKVELRGLPRDFEIKSLNINSQKQTSGKK